jgi:adenylate cyclase class 2
MQLEVELKFRVDDTAALLARLNELGISLHDAIEQIDTYFRHPARDFAVTDEAFRLRQIGDANFFTYKGPKLDAETKTRRELEVPLTPGAVAADYQQLLLALGFAVGGVVRKLRRRGECQVGGPSVEIAMDYVDGVGVFVELEIVADESERGAATAAIQTLAKDLRLAHAERRSYLELMLSREPSS